MNKGLVLGHRPLFVGHRPYRPDCNGKGLLTPEVSRAFWWGEGIKANCHIYFNYVDFSTAWNPNLRSKTAIRTSDTRYFIDPSIATAALGLGPKDLINDMNTFGLIFETLAVRDLRVYAEALDGKLYHYRDKNNLECDAVVHLRNGSYGLIEVKKTTGELKDGMQSGCAFLNTEGGWLFFGIHPTTLKILGQEVSDHTRQDIAIEMRKFAPAIDLSAQYIPVPGREGMFVIAIYFPVSVYDRTPYTYDGRPYYKVENTTMPMPREMFDERIRLSNPKKFSWELTPCDEAKLKDIDNKTLVAAINKGIAKGRIPASAASARTTLERLRPFNVLTGGDGLTNGAVVLFGKEPTRLFSHCRIKLARFEGTVMDKFRDQLVVEANLFQQLQAIEDFCRKHMFMSGDQDDFDSKNVLTVPLKVVREAALNLLAHRTWWGEARVPSVNIFDDRVEFMNPGAFPPGTGPKDFLKRPHSEPVNEKIATALFKGGEMEGWGRGIPDIYELCKEAGMPEPEFDFVTNFVCLTIRFKQPITPHLTDHGELNGSLNGALNGVLNEALKGLGATVIATYEIIKGNPGIQRKDIIVLTKRGSSTIDRHLAVLIERKLIEHRDSKKTGGYYPL